MTRSLLSPRLNPERSRRIKLAPTPPVGSIRGGANLILRFAQDWRIAGSIRAGANLILRFAQDWRIAFALGFALNVTAQIVSPTQQSYGPYRRPAEGFEPALVSSRNAILLAWSELDDARISRIRCGLLDFHGRLTSPIVTVPSIGRAAWPAVATDGANFRLVYFEYRFEPRLERRYAMAVDIDAAGTIVGEPHQLHAYNHAPPATFPIVYWNGSAFTFVDRPIDEAAAVIDEHLAGAVWDTKWALTGCFLFHCIYSEVLELNWWAVHGVNGSYRPYPSPEPAALAMAGRGNYATIAWNSGLGVQYVELTNGAVTWQPLLIPASVSTNDRPGLGCDDTHCLVAYATKSGDVYAALYRRNQPGIDAQVPIELGSRFAKPHVLVLQNGRFLVSYVSTTAFDGDRFAGRIVTTEPPAGRRRAVR
jgi:hypothetical protein